MPLVDARLTYWTIILNDFHMIPSSNNRNLRTATTRHSKKAATPRANFCNPYCFAIVDTGTSFTYAPPQLFDEIMHHVTDGFSCNLETFQCEDATYENFPTLSFSFGKDQDKNDNYFRMKPEDYLFCEDSVCDIQLRNHAYVVSYSWYSFPSHLLSLCICAVLRWQ